MTVTNRLLLFRLAFPAAVLSFIFIFTSPLAALPNMVWDALDQWETQSDGKSTVELSSVKGKHGSALRVRYELAPNGWVQIRRVAAEQISETQPVTFWVRAESPSTLEVKVEDQDGSNFLRRIPLKDKYKDWTRLVLYSNSLEYGWGGDDALGDVRFFHFAISGQGSGTVDLDQIGLSDGMPEASFPSAGPRLDPDRELEGFGARQRREAALTPEDPMVYEWIKANQDASSPEKRLVSSMDDNIAQTFNNALCAMVFILKKDRERAERILDFYASAMDRNNEDPTLQNFYVKGKPLGFFQSIWLKGDSKTAYHSLPSDDRWVGDMAWLLIAYHYYGKTYASKKYSAVSAALKDLLLSFYKKDKIGGFIQSGWSKGDTKFHENGYGEPNIDCYSAFLLTGETARALDIRLWLEVTLKGRNLPLDNYSWRVLAFGKDSADLLNIPEYDLRFRKTLNVRGRKVTGFYHNADDVQNIWLDGIGHMACAYFAVGNAPRGNFYANQYDALMIDQVIGGKSVRGFPYTLNKLGGNDWVDPTRGHVSVAVWYIFAKNRFNPLTVTVSPAVKPATPR